MVNRFTAVEPRAPNDAPGARRLVWVVRATGHFVGMRVPPGRGPIVGTSGYLIIGDKTGEILGMGLP
jgi:hypothetical protein